MTLTRGPHGGFGGRRWPPGCSWRGRVPLGCWNSLSLGHSDRRRVLRSRARLRSQSWPRFPWSVGGGSGGRPRRLRTRNRPVACFWLGVCRKLGILCSIIIPAPSERREAGRTPRRTRAANGIKKILLKASFLVSHLPTLSPVSRSNTASSTLAPLAAGPRRRRARRPNSPHTVHSRLSPSRRVILVMHF